MAPSNDGKNDGGRPFPIISNTFSKLESGIPKSPTRTSRASTIPNGTPVRVMSDKTNMLENKKSEQDVFEKSSGGEHEATDVTGKLPADFDELPIELFSLSDSFIDSLSAKVHPTPPTVDKLSGLFQDFYAVAANHINTHISALSSRQHRSASPAHSISSLSSTASKIRAKAVSINKDKAKPPPQRQGSDQQMMTPEEIADRKCARRVLEHKRVALEEAVERRVCEGIYDRIWRHRSTQDEASDDKLRSKTAALLVVGIGLTDLGVDVGQDSSETEREIEVRDWLEGAREALVSMNNEKYPLGKLHHLKEAHKSIVDTLAHFHPSSSADEIMPMLIYTLITSPPEGNNVISNLYFIQRFRCESKIDGEAAYCLTNLEAAITFLETVDLASLREDEAPSGPVKPSSRPASPQERPGLPTSSLSAPVLHSSNTGPTTLKAPPSPSGLKLTAQPTHNRRLSDLFQPPAQAIGAASDTILNTADQGFKSIGNSLGDSYKFLLGKLKERQKDPSGRRASEIIVPKTLEDARKLVGTPPPEDDGSASEQSSLHSPSSMERNRSNSGASKTPDDKVLSMITGLKMSRDRSTDSIRSVASSSKKVAFAQEASDKLASSPINSTSPPAEPALSPANPAVAMAESMRNLGNTLNPMNRIAGMGMMRGFGRSPTASPNPVSTPKSIADGGVADLTTTFPDLAPVLPPKETPKISPPIKKFMKMQNPGELKINEVLELLRDYRRLAGALKDLGAV